VQVRVFSGCGREEESSREAGEVNFVSVLFEAKVTFFSCFLFFLDR